MGKGRLRLPWLLVLSLLIALALSCSGSSSMNQTGLSAQMGTPLPLTQDGAIPAVPDPVEVYVVKTDGGDPKLVTVLSGVPMWAWSPDDDHAALITDITDHSARVNVISVEAGTAIATADIAGYPQTVEWSPTGGWLAWKSGTQDGSTLEAMRADGSGRQELTTAPGYGTGSITVIGWTPDDRLLVTRWEEGSDSELLQFDPASGGKRRVAALPEWAQPAGLSKDASQMAFIVGAGDIGCAEGSAFGLWVVDLATSDLRQVPPDTCGLASATWSPDGAKLAYSVETNDDARGTYALDVASGASRKLGGSETFFDYVRGWLPDGTGVLVDRSNCPVMGFCYPGSSQLVLIPSAGGDEKVIANDVWHVLSPDGAAAAFDKDGLQIDQIPNGPSREAMASDSDWQFNLLDWSPDGQWFSFARSHSRGFRQFEVNADGSGLKRLEDLSNWPDMPPWDDGEVPSPDGSKVALLGDPLQIRDAQSGNQVSVDGIHGGQAAWSPDGERLVFATCPLTSEGASPIHLVDADGTGLKQLTDGSSRDCFPTISPDGKSVACVRLKDLEQVITLDIDSLEEKTLLAIDPGQGPANDWPAWSPDGKLLALNIESGGIYVIKADGSGGQEEVAGDWFGGQYVGVRWQSDSRLYFVSAQ